MEARVMGPEDTIFGLEKEYGISGSFPDGSGVDLLTLKKLAEILITRDPALHHSMINQFDNHVGGRFYVDTGDTDVPMLGRNHRVEFATPECPSAKSLALYDRATDVEALDRFQKIIREPKRFFLPQASYHLFKASTDWKSNWWGGRHLNIRILDHIKTAALIRYLAPFLLSKPIWAGAGGVGPMVGDMIYPETPLGFIFSPRALIVQSLVGDETAGRSRPLIGTGRFHEAHSHDLPGWRRLQLIEGDPLLSDITAYVEAGLISLIIRLLAVNGFPSDFPYCEEGKSESIIDDFHKIVRDPTLKVKIRLSPGVSYTALELQKKYYELLLTSKSILDFTDEDQDVVRRFGKILEELSVNPELLSRENECWFKHGLFTRALRKYQAAWETCQKVKVEHGKKEIALREYLLMLHHQATALDDWGIWPQSVKRGIVDMLHTPQEVESALVKPPPSRAAFRVAVFERARIAGVKVEAERDLWSTLKFGNGERLIKLDPTQRGNEEKIKEAEAIIQKISLTDPGMFPDPPGAN